MSAPNILDAKTEFRNFFIELRQNSWFCTIFDCNQLESINSTTFSSESKTWQYDVKKLIFKNINIERHVRPKAIKATDDATLELSVLFEGEYEPLNNKIYDQISRLGVSFFIKCDYINTILNDVVEAESQWHLDKHDPSRPIQTIHPIYHFEFGGAVTTEEEGFDFGNFIILDAPRLLHPPLDIVLAIDFVLKNFYKYEDNKAITGSATYQKYIKNAQYRLWRPYALAFARNFEPLPDLDIDKAFSENIIECPH